MQVKYAEISENFENLKTAQLVLKPMDFIITLQILEDVEKKFKVAWCLTT